MKRNVEYEGVRWTVEDPQTPGWPFWDRWEAGTFEPETIEIIDRLVVPGSTFIDIGAWCGPFSLWAARTARRVVALEPDPVAFALLQHNAAANYDNITTVNAALNDYSGTCFVDAPKDVGWGVCTTHLAESGVPVPCLTMEDLFDVCDITDASLVKMDIEGAEGIVLPTVAPFLASTGTPLLVSIHGIKVDPSWFDTYKSYEFVDDFPDPSWKSILALP